MRRVDFRDTDQQTIEFIVGFVKEHLYPPSIREIARGTGVASTNTVAYRLRRLEDFGKIKLDETGRITLLGYELKEREETCI